jgi:putative salt-induced outer membrane protein YdiY
MNNTFKLGLVAVAMSSPLAFAEEAEKSPFEVSAELGILINTGNTESSSFLGKAEVKHDLVTWKNKYTVDYLQKEAQIINQDGSKSTQETENRFSLTGQADYKFNEKSAAFIFGSYTDDEYGAYETYTTVSGGYSLRALEKENMFLDLNAGAGFASAETGGASEDSAVYRGAAAFEWKINGMTKFVQNISIEHAPDLGDDGNTRTITETGVSASFNSSMKMKFSYKTTTNSQVADGFEKTDTETAVTLVMNF